MKKTRKIKNKKLFLKWLKKSRRNKYNITRGGTRPPTSDIVIAEARKDMAAAATKRDAADAAERDAAAAADSPIINLDDYAGEAKVAVDAAAHDDEELLVKQPKSSFLKRIFSKNSTRKIQKDINGEAMALKEETNKTKNVAIALAVSTSLADMALSLASNPVVIAAFAGISIVGSLAFSVVTAGAPLVFIGIVWYTITKVNTAFGNYYKMVHVMNNLMLLLKRIHNVLMVAIKIGNQYSFIFETKDIVNSLEKIIKKFDAILSVEGRKEIAEEILNDVTANKVKFEYEPSVEDKIKEEEEEKTAEIRATTDADKKSNSDKKSKPSSFKTFFKKLFFNADDFSKELNEEVTKLTLFFSIFLGEFNILFNVSQVTVLTDKGKDMDANFSIVRDKNNEIKYDPNFEKVVMSTLLYRILQIHNMFELCERNRFRDTLCRPGAMEGYVKEVVTEIEKINNILSKPDKYTLYRSTWFDKLKQLMSNTEIIVYKNKVTTESKNRAQIFCKKIADFNTEISKSSST